MLFEHPLSSYVQKVKIALREKGITFRTEIPHELGSGRAGGEVSSLIIGLTSGLPMGHRSAELDARRRQE